MKIIESERPWGRFRQFTHNEKTTVKIITVKKGEVLSLQSHKRRSEFWRVIRGSGTVEINSVAHNASLGDEFTIALGDIHRMAAGSDGLEILEIAFGDFDENDIIRYEDRYGRA